MRLALVSLEPWDDVWRRNQHLVASLLDQGLATGVAFVEPTARQRTVTSRQPRPGLTVLRPPLLVPKRAGGLRLTGALLRRTALRDVDVLWVNDPSLGVHCLAAGRPAVYDVTDDWRAFDFPPRIRRRLVRAEDRLARRATTVVCSEVLRERWRDRYGVDAAVVHNGVDAAAWQHVVAAPLAGPGPHVGYVGTLHEERLDVDLVVRLARHDGVGTVHLVGPDALGAAARARLQAEPAVRIEGPVPAREVPAWMSAMDVLVSPHAVTPFTLSLDAIKSYEYAVSARPVVATPTSGFQHLAGRGVVLAGPQELPAAVAAAAGRGPVPTVSLAEVDWAGRARELATVLQAAGGRP